MTPRERVICALEHRQPDRIPWTVELTHVEHQKLVYYTVASSAAKRIRNGVRYNE